MDRDGTTDGYDLELTRAVAEAVAVPVIASGGAGELDHLVEAVEAGHADAVLCASIFHYGRHTVAEAKQHDGAGGDPRPVDLTRYFACLPCFFWRGWCRGRLRLLLDDPVLGRADEGRIA